MVRLFVTYAAGDGTRFDRDYYVATHLPLVEKEWGPAGLQTARAYFPAGDGPDVAVAVLTFASDDAIAAALASSSVATVMGDVPNFTDITPTIARGTAL